MDPLQLLGALGIIEDLDEAEEDAENVNKRFSDGAGKNAFIDLSDEQFIKYFRLSKHLARQLIGIVAPFIALPARPRHLSLEKKVLTALRFFGTGSYQGITGSDAYVYVSQATVSRSIHDVIDALNRPEVMNQFVQFPRNIAEMEDLQNRFFNRFQFPGIIGCIDCTHVAIIAPKNNDEEHPEHIYVCDENLKILDVNARFPGSAHDARIWNQSQVSAIMEQVYRNRPNDPLFLLGDSGYPLRPWLQTPIRDPAPNSPEERFNNALTSIRSLIERCNGVLKNRFRCLLKHRVLHYSPTTACKIINACVILHNICIEANLLEVEEEDIGEENHFGMYDVPAERHHQGFNQDLEAGRAVRRHVIDNYFN